MVTIKIEKINQNIIDFIQSNGFEIPDADACLVAYDDNQIIGVSCIKKITLIEPFICNNPLVANNLYQRTEALAQLTNNELYVLTSSEKVCNLLKKLGYKELSDIKVWRKRWD